MKRLHISLFLIAYLICGLQSGASTTFNPDFKTPLYPGSKHKIYDKAIANAFINPPHDTCLSKKFSVVFYLIQDSLGSLPNTPSTNTAHYINTFALPQIINILNTAFAPICVSFEHCKTNIIPNYSYNKWTAGSTDSVVLANWYTEKTINIYIPAKEFLSAPITDSTAYTPVFPLTGNTRPKDFIVLFKGPSYPASPMYMQTNATTFLGSDIVHTMGHFFGLRHTFAETSVIPVLPSGPSTEPVSDLLNCPVSPAVPHGDGFCDTEADPYPAAAGSGTAAPCGYKQATGTTDQAGAYYTPPLDNFMSVYQCRCRFTQQQYNYMARFIATRRLYLH